MREISKYIFSVSCDAEELLSVLGSSSQWQRPSTQTSTSPHFEGGNPLHSLVSPPTTAPVMPIPPLCTLVCWFCLHVVETLVSIFSQKVPQFVLGNFLSVVRGHVQLYILNFHI